jgi:hypothetical protein
MPVSGTAPVIPPVLSKAELGSIGDVGLWSTESEQDEIRTAATRTRTERKELGFTIWPEMGDERATAPPKATAMPSVNCFVYKDLQKYASQAHQ